MEADRQAATNGHAPFPADRVVSSTQLEDLQAAYRRQAHVIDTLTVALMRLRSEATALEADNADLRGELDRFLRGSHRLRAVDTRPELAEPAEHRIVVAPHAPVLVRAVLATALADLPASVLVDAQLLASELITNSVQHSGASPDDALLFRFRLSSTTLRLEVQDPGRGATMAPHLSDVDGGGGGLHIVDTFSKSWGVERSTSGTRVWADLALEPRVISTPDDDVSKTDEDDDVTLRTINSDGANLELDMPSWAVEALRGGQAIAFKSSEARDWSDVVEDDGTTTRRLPVDSRDWTQLHHD
jgi:anti-sigma regulatory factor (Ser/Thr protein kinase)